jgi:hypothetical protein
MMIYTGKGRKYYNPEGMHMGFTGVTELPGYQVMYYLGGISIILSPIADPRYINEGDGIEGH